MNHDVFDLSHMDTNGLPIVYCQSNHVHFLLSLLVFLLLRQGCEPQGLFSKMSVQSLHRHMDKL